MQMDFETYSDVDTLITLHQRERENTDFGRKET